MAKSVPARPCCAEHLLARLEGARGDRVPAQPVVDAARPDGGAGQRAAPGRAGACLRIRTAVRAGFERALIGHSIRGVPVVVCLDEAQTMPAASLEQLRLLSNMETEKAKLMQLVLFGQPGASKPSSPESAVRPASPADHREHPLEADARHRDRRLPQTPPRGSRKRQARPVRAGGGAGPDRRQRGRAAPGQHHREQEPDGGLWSRPAARRHRRDPGAPPATPRTIARDGCFSCPRGPAEAC